MKRPELQRVYSKLTPQEQAALVFEASTRQDKSEADVILNCVSIKNYSMPDLDYQQRMQGLSNLSGVYGMVFWKALFLLSSFKWTQFDNDFLPETIKQHIKRFNSIEVAIEAICKQMNIKVSTLKEIAECDTLNPDFGDEIDSQYVRQYNQLFASIAYLD